MDKKIMNSLELLDLKNLDIEIYNFLHYNFNYFNNNLKDISIKDNEFTIISNNNGMFKVSMIPNILTPTSIYIELVNLDSNYVQSYTIDYLEKEKNSIKVTYKKYLNVLNNQSNTTIVTFYDNNRKTFIKKNDSFTSFNSIRDNSCSRESKKYYYSNDEKYVEQVISVGMVNSIFPTSISYSKYDGKDISKIGQQEFSTLRYRKNNKILKKVA